MADFRTKVLTLAGVATMCAGMAYGQATIGAASAATTFVRAEDKAAMLPALTVQINMPSSNAVTLSSVSVFLSPSVSITSQSSGTPAVSETTIVQTNNQNANCPNLGPNVAGSVSGNSVTFSSVALGTPNGAGCVVTLTIQNIRIDATTVTSGNGIPGSVSAQAFIQGTNTTPGTTISQTLAYVQNGLSKTTVAGVASNSICNAVAPAISKTLSPNTVDSTGVYSNGTTAAGSATVTLPNPSFTLTVGSVFGGAFKTNALEQGTGIAVGSGTRVAITFANVPSNVNIYLPITIYSSPTPVVGNGAGAPVSTATMTLIKSNVAGALGGNTATAVTPSSSNGLLGIAINVGQVTIANGTGTAYYEVATADALVDTFTVPVMLQSAAGALTSSTSAITATTAFSQISTSSLPLLTASSASTVTGSAYGACSTNLLFPYVTNFGVGSATAYETGISLSNTSLDSLGAKGASQAAAQAGTCVLSFFGNATASSNPANYTTASIPAGTNLAFTLSTATNGAAFTGYALANCNFQYAHGFAYITYSIGNPNAMAMGYLAEVLPSTANRTIAANAAEALTH